MENNQNQYTPSDYKNKQSVRWCPGCGDHAILNVLHKAMAELQIPPEQTVVVSGIGCSSRLPYYMNTYGMHTIHGRAAAIATGVKTSRPDLTVWQISGDGDGLAIGGNPAELCFGARGTFFARSFDVALDTTKEVMVAAARHKGASVVEVLQNCMIFNNGAFAWFTDREERLNRTIHLRHGEKMLFGTDLDLGLVQDGFGLKAVKLGEDGYTIDDVLVHDAHCESNFLHQQLAMMDGHSLPIAIGVIRDVEAPSYETEVAKQVETVKAKKGFKNLRDMILKTTETWEVK